MENARKVSKRIRRIRGKYLSAYGEHDKLGLFAVHKIVIEYAEIIYVYMEKTQKDSWCILLIRQKT
jgi:hypothetical protein